MWLERWYRKARNGCGVYSSAEGANVLFLCKRSSPSTCDSDAPAADSNDAKTPPKSAYKEVSVSFMAGVLTSSEEYFDALIAHLSLVKYQTVPAPFTIAELFFAACVA